MGSDNSGWQHVTDNTQKKGLLVVLSGPSGSGKDTVIKILRSKHAKLHYTVTTTTRAPRNGEVDWENYHFVTREEFAESIAQNAFIEWVEYNGNLYGTPRDQVIKALEEGKIVILKIEVRGAIAIKKTIPHAVYVFITTPTEEELIERLKGRETDLHSDQKERLAIANDEVKEIPNYDYLIINHNDQALSCAEKVWSIIVAESCRVGRQDVAQFLNDQTSIASM